MEKKIYFCPKFKIYSVNVKSSLLAGSDDAGFGDGDGDMGSKSTSGANINWEGDDE